MSAPEPMTTRPMARPGSRPPAIGRTAINEFRKARAQFRAERAAAEEAADALHRDDGAESDDGPTAAELVLLAHGEPLSLALTRRRRDESASLDRRLRLSRLIAREDQVTASIAELTSGTIDLRDGADAERDDDALAPVLDLRPRPASPRAVADADTPVV